MTKRKQNQGKNEKKRPNSNMKKSLERNKEKNFVKAANERIAEIGPRTMIAKRARASVYVSRHLANSSGSSTIFIAFLTTEKTKYFKNKTYRKKPEPNQIKKVDKNKTRGFKSCAPNER